jgi:hypothetical protein
MSSIFRIKVIMLSFVRSSNDYHDTFRPLLNLNKESDVLSLISDELPSPPSPSSSYFPSFFVASSSVTNTRISKLFQKKIKQWTDSLDSLLESNRYHPLELQLLQEAVRPIFMEGKLTILKEKIRSRHLLSDKLSNTIAKLDAYLIRVLTTPCLTRLKMHEPGSPTGWPFLALTGYYSITRSSFPQQHADPVRIQQDRESLAKQLQNSRQAADAALFTPAWGKAWQERLIESVKQLNKEGEIKALGKKLTPLQACVLVNAFVHDQSEEWKLIFILGGLNTPAFLETLQSFDPNLLCFLNAFIQRGSSHALLSWFKDAIRSHRNDIEKGCLATESKVNALAERFEKDLKGYLLTEGDIQHIHELADNVRLRLHGISQLLPQLLKNLKLDTETYRSLFEEIPSRYAALLKRLTETRYDENCPVQYLLPIIYHKVFTTSCITDEEEAFEILGTWGIINLKQYWKVGLFGEIDKTQFKQLESSHPNSFLFGLARDNLAELGIHTIGDWKQIAIFNAIMLNHYLNRSLNRDILTLRTKRIHPFNDTP